MQTKIQCGDVSGKIAVVRDLRLFHSDLVLCGFGNVVSGHEKTVVKGVGLLQHAVFVPWNQALRNVCTGTAAAECVHPLAPRFVQCVEVVPFGIEDALPSAFVPVGMVETEILCQHKISVPPDRLQAGCLGNGVEITGIAVCVKECIRHIAPAVVFVQRVVPAAVVGVWRAEDDLVYPAGLPPEFHTICPVKFQNGKAAHLWVQADLKRPVTGDQRFRDRPLYQFAEIVFLCDLLPEQLLRFGRELHLLQVGGD